jgi:hypothetical protein
MEFLVGMAFGGLMVAVVLVRCYDSGWIDTEYAKWERWRFESSIKDLRFKLNAGRSDYEQLAQ